MAKFEGMPVSVILTARRDASQRRSGDAERQETSTIKAMQRGATSQSGNTPPRS